MVSNVYYEQLFFIYFIAAFRMELSNSSVKRLRKESSVEGAMWLIEDMPVRLLDGWMHTEKMSLGSHRISCGPCDHGLLLVDDFAVE